MVAGAFYFWNSGCDEQRPQEGLFCTLLHDVLEEHRDLIPKVFPEEWHRNSLLAANDLNIESEKWCRGALEAAFRRLVNLANSNMRLCFFIDGLDEYDGEPGDIADLFEDISKSSLNAKFCVSSRPLPAFQAFFWNSCCLKLQDLTEDDIMCYVHDKFGCNRQMQQLLDRDRGNAAWLKNEIVNRAAGVFLWVVLVVKMLIKGLQNGDSISHLKKQLCSLPVDLERLFDRMLDQIDPEYKGESSKIFQIFRASGNQLRVLQLHHTLLHSNFKEALNMRLEEEKRFRSQSYFEDMEFAVEQMTLRLNSRSRGLLEVEYEHNPPDTSKEDGSLEDTGNRLDSIPEALDDLQEVRITSCNSGWAGSIGTVYASGKSPPDYLRTPTLNRLEPSTNSRGQLRKRFPHRVVYLHRTARDFLEQPKIWSRIAQLTAKSNFEPNLALLMGYVVQVKTEPISAIWKTAQKVLTEIAKLSLSATWPAMALVDEIDKVLTIRWREAGGEGHWTRLDPRWQYVDTTSLWGGDITYVAQKCGLTWYSHAKVDNGASLLPLLADSGAEVFDEQTLHHYF